MSLRPLRRVVDHHAVLAGVAAGTAYALGLPIWAARLLWIVAGLMGHGIILYILLWLLVPVWNPVPTDYEARTHDGDGREGDGRAARDDGSV